MLDERIDEEDALVLGIETTEATDHKTSLAIVAQDPSDELSTPISADPVATETLETIPRLAKGNGEEFVSINPVRDPPDEWLAIEPAMNEDATAECQVVRNFGTKLVWAESPNQAAILANEKEKLVYLIQVSGNFEIPEFT